MKKAYELVPKERLVPQNYMGELEKVIASSDSGHSDCSVKRSNQGFWPSSIRFKAKLEGTIYGIYELNRREKSVSIAVEARDERRDMLRAQMSMSLKFKDDSTLPKLIIKSYKGNFPMRYILRELEIEGFYFVKSP